MVSVGVMVQIKVVSAMLYFSFDITKLFFIRHPLSQTPARGESCVVRAPDWPPLLHRVRCLLQESPHDVRAVL